MVIFRAQISDPEAPVTRKFSSTLRSVKEIKLPPLLLKAFAVSQKLSKVSKKGQKDGVSQKVQAVVTARNYVPATLPRAKHPKTTTEHVQNTVLLSSCSFPEQAQVEISPKPAEGSAKEN